jgi:hypothetical protein
MKFRSYSLRNVGEIFNESSPSVIQTCHFCIGLMPPHRESLSEIKCWYEFTTFWIG